MSQETYTKQEIAGALKCLMRREECLMRREEAYRPSFNNAYNHIIGDVAEALNINLEEYE